MIRHGLTDAQWTRIENLIPGSRLAAHQRARQGHPGGEVSRHHVRFHRQRTNQRLCLKPLCAESGCEQSQQGSLYSITSSARASNVGDRHQAPAHIAAVCQQRTSTMQIR